jgi:hypothetical protein
LSTCTLHFGETQIAWGCKHTYTCETFPERIPGVFVHHWDDIQDLDLATFWQSILKTYTKAKLTYTKDRLIAISGIAKRFQKQTHDEWVAGLWKRDLLIQLCWHVEYLGKAFRPSQYQAPSWSWASVEGAMINIRLKYDRCSYDFCAHIIDIQVGLEALTPSLRFAMAFCGSNAVLCYAESSSP